jgi:hypothetical protein
MTLVALLGFMGRKWRKMPSLLASGETPWRTRSAAQADWTYDALVFDGLPGGGAGLLRLGRERRGGMALPGLPRQVLGAEGVATATARLSTAPLPLAAMARRHGPAALCSCGSPGRQWLLHSHAATLVVPPTAAPWERPGGETTRIRVQWQLPHRVPC